MHKSQSLFCLGAALHVSDFTITHLQEHKTTVTTVIVNSETCRAVLRQNKLCGLCILLGFIY